MKHDITAAVMVAGILIVLAVLMLPKGCYAADAWSTADKVIGSVALAATMADWSQTRYIARHPDSYRELNHLLPDHPSVSQVDAHFAGHIVLGALIANWLPEDYRRYFLGGVSVLEIGVAAHNQSIGVKMRF